MKRALATVMLLCLGACNALTGVGDFEVVPGATSTTISGAGAGGATSSSGKGGGGSGTGGDAGATTATGTATGTGMGGAGASGGAGSGGAGGAATGGGGSGGAGGAGGGPLACMKHADCPSEACLGGSCATIVQVAAGATFACAVLGDGTAHCWGRNHDGQLGDGTFTPQYKPQPVPSLTDVVAIAVSRTAVDETSPEVHACARLASGAVKCWGNNVHGQLGIGAAGADQPSPQSVLGNATFSRIAVGSKHTCGIAAAQVWCWGRDAAGEVGDGGANQDVFQPVMVLGDATDVALGQSFTCALRIDGTVRCWGSNSKKQLGVLTGSSGVPVPVPGLVGAVAVAAGRDFACAKKSATEIWCWGDNSDAQITTMNTSSIAPPIVATKLTAISLLSLGVDRDDFSDGGHGCAVLTDGSAKCWGENASGQIGDGTTGGDVPLPVAPMGLGSVKAVSAGADFTCAITAAGALRCWGRNNEGQLGIGTETAKEPLALPVIWP
jgi:alpha-tubulin suppressor-like RCC1 family protein